MTDEITSNPTPQTPIEPQPASQLEPAQIPKETSVSESSPLPMSPQEPIGQAPIPPTESTPAEVPSVAPEASPNHESAIPVKDQNLANEPLNQPFETAPTKQEPQQNPDPEPIKNPPETLTSQPTAQMAGNEPFDKTQNKPLGLAEEIKTKQREENLKLANQTRQEKKERKLMKF